MQPYIYRTHDGGKTWQNVVAGIPEGAFVNSVKEDPQAKGLALRRHRTARLRFVQRRRPVAAAAEQHAGHLRSRHRRAWRRSRHRHLRPRLLGAGPDDAPCARSPPRATRSSRPRPISSSPARPSPSAAAARTARRCRMKSRRRSNPPAGVVAYYWLKSAPTGPLKLELVDAGGKVAACAASDTPGQARRHRGDQRAGVLGTGPPTAFRRCRHAPGGAECPTSTSEQLWSACASTPTRRCLSSHGSTGASPASRSARPRSTRPAARRIHCQAYGRWADTYATSEDPRRPAKASRRSRQPARGRR